VAAGTHPSGPWQGRPLADHGELWSRAWHVEAATPTTLTATIEGWRFPYTFQRRLRLRDGTIRADYEVENRSPADFPAAWSMHPLLRPEPAMRLALPAAVEMRVESSSRGDLATAGDRFRWPRLGSLDLSNVPADPGRLALKLFSAPLTVGRAALVAQDGWLGLSFDTDVASFLGVWLDYEGWPAGAPLEQLALEPTTGDGDDLGKLAARGRTMVVPARGSVAWSVTIQVGTGPRELEAFLGSRPAGVTLGG